MRELIRTRESQSLLQNRRPVEIRVMTEHQVLINRVLVALSSPGIDVVEEEAHILCGGPSQGDAGEVLAQGRFVVCVLALLFALKEYSFPHDNFFGSDVVASRWSECLCGSSWSLESLGKGPIGQCLVSKARAFEPGFWLVLAVAVAEVIEHHPHSCGDGVQFFVQIAGLVSVFSDETFAAANIGACGEVVGLGCDVVKILEEVEVVGVEPALEPSKKRKRI